MQSTFLCLVTVFLLNISIGQSQQWVLEIETTSLPTENSTLNLSPEEECQESVVRKFSAQLFEVLDELKNLTDDASSQELRDIAGNSATTLNGALDAARLCPTLDCLDQLGATTLAQFNQLNAQISNLENITQNQEDAEQIKSLNTQSSNLIGEALKELAQCGGTSAPTEETTQSLSPDEKCQESVVRKFSAQLFEVLGELQNMTNDASSQELRDIAGQSAATLNGALQAAKVCPTLDCLDQLGATTLVLFNQLNDQITNLQTGNQDLEDAEQIKSLNTQSSNLIDQALKELAQCGGDSTGTGIDEEMSTTPGF